MNFNLQSAANWAQLVSLVVAVVALFFQIQSMRSSSSGLGNLKKSWVRVLPSYILVAALAFFVATAIPKEARSVQVDLPNNINSPLGNPDVTISRVKFTYPNEILLEGTYTNLPERSNLFTYVFATNNRFYIEKIRNFDNGTWETVDDVDIGSPERHGGKYELGLLAADLQKCPELQNQDGLIALPSCAVRLNWVKVIRF